MHERKITFRQKASSNFCTSWIATRLNITVLRKQKLPSNGPLYKHAKKTVGISLLLALLVTAIVFGIHTLVNFLPERQLPDLHDNKSTLPILALGIAHSCALANQQVTCWGSDREGQIKVPVGLSKPVQLTAGAYHNCVIEEITSPQHPEQKKRSVLCWGAGEPGETGRFDFGQSIVPQTVQNSIAISAGWYHTCAINEWPDSQAVPVRKVICWGVPEASRLYFGQLDVPDHLQNPRLLSAGAWHTCAVDDNGISCWGADSGAEFNGIETVGFGQATPPANLQNITAIASGDAHSCVLHQQQVSCWGNNDFGQLNVPEEVVNVQALSAGMNHTCAIGDEGLICWGSNYSDELSAPEVNIDYGFVLASGAMHNCVANNEKISCWGANNFNQSQSVLFNNVPKLFTKPMGQHKMITNTADLGVE